MLRHASMDTLYMILPPSGSLAGDALDIHNNQFLTKWNINRLVTVNLDLLSIFRNTSDGHFKL